MSRYLVDRIVRDPKIEVRCDTEVRELVGDDTLQALVLENTQTGTRDRVECRALFVFIGAEPHAGWLGGQLELDEHGFVRTGSRTGDGSCLPLETSWPGVFAAGDVRSGSIKRVAAAVGEGSMAVRLVHEHLARK